MGPTEAEIEARLAELRRRRDAIDREIADHLLYLELGRRLRAGSAAVPEAAAGTAPDAGIAPPAPAPAAPRAWTAPAAQPQAGPAPVTAIPPRPAPPDLGLAPGAPAPVPFEEDPAAARRYGRALVEAALAILVEANRPMHAGEILERLSGRGFTVPGQDPVAALNTRLWKRSGPGGPLRRLGDAVYAPADAAGLGLPGYR